MASPQFEVVTDNLGKTWLIDNSSRTRYQVTGAGQLAAVTSLYGPVRTKDPGGGPVFLTGWNQGMSVVDLFGGPGGIERFVAGESRHPITGSRNAVQGPQEHQPGVPEQPTVAPEEPKPRNLRQEARALFPWMPNDLVKVFVDAWAETDSVERAMIHVRQSPLYEKHFPGNLRPDGTVRNAEQVYVSIREAMERSLAQRQVNPRVFREQITAAISGDVSPAEFESRLQAKWERVISNAPAVREEYGRFYGLTDLSDSALLAASLDPKIGADILNRRISAAEVAGEYAMRGFTQSLGRVETLLNAGVTQRQAAQVAGAAQTAVPQYGAFADRYRDKQGFGLEDFEDASVLNDSRAQQRMRRLSATERSNFTGNAQQVREGRAGNLEGLRQR